MGFKSRVGSVVLALGASFLGACASTQPQRPGPDAESATPPASATESKCKPGILSAIAGSATHVITGDESAGRAVESQIKCGAFQLK